MRTTDRQGACSGTAARSAGGAGGASARAAALLALLVRAATCGAAQEGLTIRCAAYVDAAGELRDGAVVHVEDGRITWLGGNAGARATGAVHDYATAVLCPGLIDVHAALGAFGQLSERQSALQPQATAVDAFDAYHRELPAALSAGVTSFGLAPDDSNLVGGRMAVCKTSGAGGRPHVLLNEGPFKLSLASDVFEPDREPTSRAGALGMLRAALEAARAPDAPLAPLLGGRRAVLATAPSGADVLALLELAQTYGLKLVLVHQLDVRSVGAEIAAAGTGVVVGPLDWSASPRTASAPGILEKLGVPVALAGGLPDAPADGLRIAAAVAARNGMSCAAARRAITIEPARMLGVAERVGAIEAGRDADLVVFSGDPLDLRSRVLAVYVDGQRIYAARER